MDGVIRFFYDNGVPCAEPMEEMECDSVASHGTHMMTTFGSGLDRTVIFWAFRETGGVEEIPADEI